MSASRHNGEVRLPEPLGDPITTIDFPVPEERLTGYYLHLIQDPSATRQSLWMPATTRCKRHLSGRSPRSAQPESLS